MLLGNYLRKYIEKNISLPETVSVDNIEDLYQFMHLSELEENPPTWGSGKKKKNKELGLESAKLTSKVDIRYTEEKIKLSIGKTEMYEFIPFLICPLTLSLF